MRRALFTFSVLIAGLGLAATAEAIEAAPARAPLPACFGCGLAIEVHTLPGATPIVSGDSYDFGSTPVGTPAVYEFAVGAEAGPGQLVVSSFTAPAGFTVDQAPPSVIAAGASHLVRVLCDATAPGTYTGNLTIVSDDFAHSPFSIEVSCTVTAVVQEQNSGGATTLATDTAGSGAGFPEIGSSSLTLALVAGAIMLLGASAGRLARRRA